LWLLLLTALTGALVALVGAGVGSIVVGAGDGGAVLGAAVSCAGP
jgi:hypothetical protein